MRAMSFALRAAFFCSRIWSISINFSFFPGPVMKERRDDHVAKQDLRQISDSRKNAEDFSSASGQTILPDSGLRLANAGI